MIWYGSTGQIQGRPLADCEIDPATGEMKCSIEPPPGSVDRQRLGPANNELANDYAAFLRVERAGDDGTGQVGIDAAADYRAKERAQAIAQGWDDPDLPMESDRSSMATAYYAGGAQRISAPSPSTPDWSPPTTVKATASGVNWDAIGSAFNSALWGGQNFASTKGNPQSYFTATPSYMKDYVESVRDASRRSSESQQNLSEQNARAFQALVAAGAKADSDLSRPTPVVVDPRNPVFQLAFQKPDGKTSAGIAGSKLVGLVIVSAVGAFLWRKMKRRRPDSERAS